MRDQHSRWRKGLVALPLLLAGQSTLAAESEPRVITLSCDGTVTDTTKTSFPLDHQPKPIEKMGVVANLNERTVSFMGFIAPISSVNAASININGEQVGPVGKIVNEAGNTIRIDGILDRVTGHMAADITTYPTLKLSDPNAVFTADHYDVLCKATNRVF